MQSIDNQLIFSATDLSHFLACSHLTLLDRRTARGGPKPPRYDDPALDVLWQRGLEHEQAYLTELRADSTLRIVEIAAPAKELPPLEHWTRYAQATLAALRSAADVIYQGALFDGRWLGRPDFLKRVATPSKLGAWSYEVIDTKLAREAKGGALLQILLYADLLASAQGVSPEYVHLALGGPEARPTRSAWRSMPRTSVRSSNGSCNTCTMHRPHCHARRSRWRIATSARGRVSVLVSGARWIICRWWRASAAISGARWRSAAS
jgi:uncharacterized protein